MHAKLCQRYLFNKIKGKNEIAFKFFFYGEIVFKKDTIVDGYHVSGTDLLFFTSFIFYYLDVSRVRSYPLYFYWAHHVINFGMTKKVRKKNPKANVSQTRVLFLFSMVYINIYLLLLGKYYLHIVMCK